MKKALAENCLFILFALCLFVGGASDGGYAANLVLQIASLLVAATVWSFWGGQGPIRHPRALAFLAIATGFIVLLQFAPLPQGVWQSLPGRTALAGDLNGLGLAPDPTLVTLLYHESISAIVWVLPAFCVFLTMMCLPQMPVRKLAIILSVFSFVSICVGLVQFFGPRDGAAYFYDITNRGAMVGFFANANHMATLLLTALPFLVALVHERAGKDTGNAAAIRLIGGLLVVLTILGLIMVGSGTGYALALPVIALSLLIWVTRPSRIVARALVPAGLVAGTAVLFITGGSNVLQREAGMSTDARGEVFADTWQAIIEFFPLGSGLGTFPDVYPMFENPDTVERDYVNHAHNDYLELALELGLPGVLLVTGFLMWWTVVATSVWRQKDAQSFVKAATIASGVILLHSVWDYPLRTAAIGAVMAVSCALMARYSLNRPQTSPKSL